MDLIEFAKQLYELVVSLLQIISSTADRLDSITFEDGSMILNYLGYAKYVMTTPLYSLFTSIVLISLGVTVWTYLLKGLGYLKNILPW